MMRGSLWRAMPPAVFPSLLGLIGLGLAWRRARVVFDLPAGAVEAFLGAITLLFAFAVGAYVLKTTVRPAAFLEDLKTVPGRAGLSTMTMGVMLMAAVLLPHAPALAPIVLVAGLAGHAAVILGAVQNIMTLDREYRMIAPSMHVTFVGPIVAPIAAVPLGWTLLSEAIFWLSMVAAAAIWAGSLGQLLRATVPAPLRPLQAIHLAPAALLGIVATLLGRMDLALGFAALASALYLLLILRARWLVAAGFSPFWGAFTFPAAAYASLMLGLVGQIGPLARGIGAVALVFATLLILPIALRVLRLWLNGTLAARTNAARA